MIPNKASIPINKLPTLMKFFLIHLFAIVSFHSVFCQEKKDSYKYGRIVLADFEVLKVKNLIISGSNLTFLNKKSKTIETIDFNQINNYQVAEKTYLVDGVLSGLGISAGAVLIANIRQKRQEGEFIEWWPIPVIYIASYTLAFGTAGSLLKKYDTVYLGNNNLASIFPKIFVTQMGLTPGVSLTIKF